MKTLIPFLEKLKIIIFIFGIILFFCAFYNIGKIHGTINTALKVTEHKGVCEVVGYREILTNKCLINCGDGSKYFINYNNNKFCLDERPTLKGKIEFFLLTGNILKEKDIYIYVAYAKGLE